MPVNLFLPLTVLVLMMVCNMAHDVSCHGINHFINTIPCNHTEAKHVVLLRINKAYSNRDLPGKHRLMEIYLL